METLYRKVAVEERLPNKSGFYFTYSSSGVKKTIWFMNDNFSYVSPSYNPEYWLEEIPDNEVDLRKENEEMKAMLEKVMANLTFYDQKLYNKIEELLNKKIK